MHRDWGTTTATGLGNGPNSGCHGNLRMWSMKKRRLRVTNVAWQHPSSRVKALILSLLPASSCRSRSLHTCDIKGDPKSLHFHSLAHGRAFRCPGHFSRRFGIITHWCRSRDRIAVEHSIDVFRSGDGHLNALCRWRGLRCRLFNSALLLLSDTKQAREQECVRNTFPTPRQSMWPTEPALLVSHQGNTWLHENLCV